MVCRSLYPVGMLYDVYANGLLTPNTASCLSKLSRVDKVEGRGGVKGFFRHVIMFLCTFGAKHTTWQD